MTVAVCSMLGGLKSQQSPFPLDTKPVSSWAGTPEAHPCANLPRNYIVDTNPLPATEARIQSLQSNSFPSPRTKGISEPKNDRKMARNVYSDF